MCNKENNGNHVEVIVRGMAYPDENKIAVCNILTFDFNFLNVHGFSLKKMSA